jgi:MFS family permease
MLDAYDLFTVAVALPLIEHDFGPTAWTLGLVAATGKLGTAVGIFHLPVLRDTWG